MQGWAVSPPKEPEKSCEEFRKEREEKVRWLIKNGYLKSERIKNALLKVPRENFIPSPYKDVRKKVICKVLYVSLRGKYGAK